MFPFQGPPTTNTNTYQPQPDYNQVQQQNNMEYQMASATMNGAFGMFGGVQSHIAQQTNDPLAQGIIGAQQGMVGMMQGVMNQAMQEEYMRRQQDPQYAYQQQQLERQQHQQYQQQPPQQQHQFNVTVGGGFGQQPQQQHQAMYINVNAPAPTSVVYGGGNAMDSNSFEALLASIKKASFESDRTTIISTAASHNYFTCEQMSKILKLLSFSSEREHTCKVIAPKVVDKQNSHVVLSALTFSSEKEIATKYLQ